MTRTVAAVAIGTPRQLGRIFGTPQLEVDLRLSAVLAAGVSIALGGLGG